MNLRSFWRQLHWAVGITAGSVLVLIGLTGAALCFREEALDALNPAGRQVAPQPQPMLAPAALAAALGSSLPDVRIATMTLYATPGRAVRIIAAPVPGESRGSTWHVDPYTGSPLPPLRGAAFFETAEALHRWLLLPREPGRVATGVLALALMALSLSGLYLRWPRRVLDWRSWWAIDRRFRGKALLRRLHLVLGTACLPLYLVLTSTGVFWAFDGVRDPVSAWLGEPRPQRAAAPRPGAAPPLPPEAVAAGLDRGWHTFLHRVPPSGWREVIVRLPSAPEARVQLTWLGADAPHERARNRMVVDAGSGAVRADERHDDKPAGGQLLAAVYPLHLGSLFGLPGRLAMFIASLLLPAFTVTGWILYLARERDRKTALARRVPPAQYR